MAEKADLSARVAALTEDGAAYKLAIERLLAAKASRDRQIAASITERNKLAQLLARNRAVDREMDRDDSRRHSTDRLSSGSAKRASGSGGNSSTTAAQHYHTSSRLQEPIQPQYSTAAAGNREPVGWFEGAEAAKQQPKGRHSTAATTPARRTALSAVSPNSLALGPPAQQAALSPRSHKADKAQSEQQLLERVNATLSNTSMDSTTSGAALDEATASPVAPSGWLSREEAMHERRTSERLKRTVQLLEEKCRELEKVTRRAQRDITTQHIQASESVRQCTVRPAPDSLVGCCVLCRCAALCRVVVLCVCSKCPRCVPTTAR